MIEQEPLPKGIVKAILEDIEKQTLAGYCAEIIVNGKVYADIETQKELDCPGSPENFVRYMRQNHITAAGIDKGHGIKILQQCLGIPKEYCIAIGDDENDLEMFEQVHMAVAMGNVKENVKRAADEITLDCDKDGAAVFLEKYCQLRNKREYLK